MVGEHDQEREAVRWELTSSPQTNNGADPQQANFATMCSGGGQILQDSMPFGSYDGYETSSTNMGATISGGPGKEVRYAPFPAIQSPSHISTNNQSNQFNQAPLQRAHSRCVFFF